MSVDLLLLLVVLQKNIGWVAITYRNQKIQIISIRRSLTEEIMIYDSKKFDTDFDDNEDVIAVLDISQVRRPPCRSKNESMSISLTG